MFGDVVVLVVVVVVVVAAVVVVVVVLLQYSFCPCCWSILETTLFSSMSCHRVKLDHDDAF